MGRPTKPIDDSTPLGALARDLRELIKASGLSVARVSQITDVPKSTIYGAMSGRRLPSDAVFVALVRAAGGPEKEWRERRFRVALQTEDDLNVSPATLSRSAVMFMRKHGLCGLRLLVPDATRVRDVKAVRPAPGRRPGNRRRLVRT
jgi:transcriptional regulator with XRE-family HTH domain